MKEGKFYNKYRITSARWQDYNYGSNGAYFVTICTKNREHFFGAIKNNKIIYSKIGKIVYQNWQKIPNHFPFVNLGEFIVMPNHIHGILFFNKNDTGFKILNDNSNNDIIKTHGVETQDFASLPQNINASTTHQTNIRAISHQNYKNNNNKFGPQSQNLASVIRGFKIGITKYIRKNTNIYDVWQSRFYDRIIRNEYELKCISQYIINNQKNWKEDDYF